MERIEVGDIVSVIDPQKITMPCIKRQPDNDLTHKNCELCRGYRKLYIVQWFLLDTGIKSVEALTSYTLGTNSTLPGVRFTSQRAPRPMMDVFKSLEELYYEMQKRNFIHLHRAVKSNYIENSRSVYQLWFA